MLSPHATHICRTLPFLLCFGVILGCAHRQFTQARLAGTWVSEWNFVCFTNIIAPDGSYVCDRVHTNTNSVWWTKPLFVQTKGTWKIEGDRVVNTTTNITGSRLKTLPVAYGRILKLSARKLVIKWDNNDTKTIWRKEN